MNNKKTLTKKQGHRKPLVVSYGFVLPGNAGLKLGPGCNCGGQRCVEPR